MENVEQVSSTDISQLFANDSVNVAAVEAVVCAYDFQVISETLRDKDTLETYPELANFSKIFQDDDCGFVHKTGSNILNIEVIVLVPDDDIKALHGDNCLQGYRLWMEYEFATKIVENSFVVQLKCNSIDIEDEFISEGDDDPDNGEDDDPDNSEDDDAAGESDLADDDDE